MMRRRCRGKPRWCALLLFALRAIVPADEVIVTPTADTTLIGEAAAQNNNAGGLAFVNAGTTQNYTTNRGLFRFDLTGSIPPGSIVTSADLTLEVVGVPKDGFAAAPFALRRVLKPWGEGDKVGDPLHPGQGAPATLGEATWNDRFALTTNHWEIPGGAPGADFVPASSSEVTVYGLADSPYTFISTPTLVADVQTWIDHPEENRGWMLMCETGDINFTARRFASREDTNRPPLLRIDFLPPRIDRVEWIGTNVSLQFLARAGQPYVVESRAEITGPAPWQQWLDVPAPLTTTNVTVTDILSGGPRFYRLRLP